MNEQIHKVKMRWKLVGIDQLKPKVKMKVAGHKTLYGGAFEDRRGLGRFFLVGRMVQVCPSMSMPQRGNFKF